jgi:hypothetical protein
MLRLSESPGSTFAVPSLRNASEIKRYFVRRFPAISTFEIRDLYQLVISQHADEQKSPNSPNFSVSVRRIRSAKSLLGSDFGQIADRKSSETNFLNESMSRLAGRMERGEKKNEKRDKSPNRMTKRQNGTETENKNQNAKKLSKLE